MSLQAGAGDSHPTVIRMVRNEVLLSRLHPMSVSQSFEVCKAASKEDGRLEERQEWKALVLVPFEIYERVMFDKLE